MKESIVSIKSSVITDAVSYLCRKAAVSLSKDVYNSINNCYLNEENNTAKSMLAEILENAQLADKKQRPICQDTGIVVVFLDMGQNVIVEGDNPEQAVNLGVEKGYSEGFLRKSVVSSPLFERENTRTNAPAVIHTRIIPGNAIKISVLLKGGGSENKSAVRMLNPLDGNNGIIDFVEETVRKAGANSCPPLHIGVGIGGTMEFAGVLSKRALLKKIVPIKELEQQAQSDPSKKLELDIYRKVQKTGIGTQGICGNYTSLGVSIETYPCHIASLPVAVTLNCHAARHEELIIDENTNIPAEIKPELPYTNTDGYVNYSDYKKLVLPLSQEVITSLKAGDKVLLSGEIYTARDAAHKKLIECLTNKKELPFNLTNQAIYYAGPCPKTKNEVVGPIGPTTSGRMDSYTPQLLDNGLKIMIGKGDRSQEVINSIKKNKAVYFTASGGVACLLAQKVTSAELIVYPELGPEAIYRLMLDNFPVIVAVDSCGNNLYSK